MRDLIIEDKAHKARAELIDSIEPETILRLASSYHNNEACKIFQPPSYGSYNVCFFVEFADDRWVVRLPIPDRIPWIDEKLEVEIATMNYVAAHTTIPIPRIHGYSFTQDSPIQLAFIIMDYVQGKNLRELGFPKDVSTWFSVTTQPTKARRTVYEQLADFYIQLRSLEFPEIGALGLPTDGDPDYRVRHRPLTIEVLLQQAEGLEPSEVFAENKTFRTAREYVDALLWLGDNLLEKSKNSFVDQYGPRGLFATHAFRRFVTERWLNRALDNGPFVLMHGDLGLQNLLWDDNLNLVAVLDWEWSSVVPLQFLVPPPWLNGNSTDFLTHGQGLYNDEVRHLNAIVREKTKALDWSKHERWCHTLIVCALLRPEYVYDVYWSMISYSLVGFRPFTPEKREKYHKIVSEQLDSYMDDEKKRFLERKMKEQVEYLAAEDAYFGRTKASTPG